MQLQYENLADVPSGDAADFVPFEQEDGKKTFMHKDLKESMLSGFITQGQLTNLAKDFETFKSGVVDKQTEAETIANKSKQDALNKQMEELKVSGKTEELHQLTMQQEADKYKSLSDSYTVLQDEFGGLKKSLVEKENLTLATTIASKYAPAEIVESFSKLLMMNNIKYVEGKSVFTNASGEAVDNDMERILEVLNQDPNLKHFAKFPDSKGGFGAKGGDSNGSDGKSMSRRWFEQKAPAEKSSIRRSVIKLTD